MREKQDVALEQLRKLRMGRAIVPPERKEAIDTEIAALNREITELDGLVSELINNGGTKDPLY